MGDRDALIVKHLPLVKAIANRIRDNLPVQVELDDLVHAGILGLFDAVDKYNPEKKVVFHLNYAQIRRGRRRWSCGGSGSRVNTVF